MWSMPMFTLFELAMRAGVIAVMSSATAGPVASDTSGRLQPRKHFPRAGAGGIAQQVIGDGSASRLCHDWAIGP